MLYAVLITPGSLETLTVIKVYCGMLHFVTVLLECISVYWKININTIFRITPKIIEPYFGMFKLPNLFF